uniref:TSA: Wollemia nobilis Ref_Wollemi_Transcript_21826_2045 transcribed RNA sequence n=1 Tax=Wollemia nobilis TaxID=56998 RepID=A0A0C9RR19_9CONI
MSILPKETIEVIAQSIGINNLSPDAAQALAPDVEYRLREIMQESIKCMRHSKRTILTTDDVNSALSLRNVEPVYGFASEDPLRFKKAVGHPDLFYIDDKDLEFKDVIEAPLPKTPLDTALLVHWLAIEGVQPAIPENPTVGALGVPPENKKTEHEKDYGLPIDVKLPVKHVLSRELQLYFEKITELIVTQADTTLFNEALVSLSTDSGLHPLVPYFTQFIADEVTRSLGDFSLLFALMRVVRSLFHNPHIHIELYLHQLMPSVVTCLVSKKLGRGFSQNHWELRDFTADIIALICRRFGHVYHNLQPRLAKTLLHAFLDPNKALTQHYGAIRGLAAMGSCVVRLLILPNLEPYLKLLEPEMVLESQKNEVKRHEAWRVYGALLHASGRCMYERVKLFPGLLSLSARATLKNTAKVVSMSHPDNAAKGIVSSANMSSTSRKRNAGPDLPSQQTSKKPVTESTIAALSAESLADSTGVTSGGHTINNLAESSMSKTIGKNSDENIKGGNRKEKGILNKGDRTASVLVQAWKEDADAGQLLASLVDLFGEGMLTFIATREMSLFL